MYFEDEKENMKDESLDDLALDLEDGDDKSITWDDLLSDDSDLDIGNIKKNIDSADAALLEDDDDLSLLDDDELLEEEEKPAPKKKRGRKASAKPKKDAFEVFGGDTDILADSESISADDSVDDLLQQDGLRDVDVAADAGDTFTPDLTSGPSARQSAGGDDDDIYFEPKSAKKNSALTPILLAFLAAALFVGGVVYFLLAYGKSVSGDDIASLLNKDKSQNTENVINQDANILDPNDPAAALLDESSAKSDEEKKDEQKEEAKKPVQKMVTLAVQSTGRPNPFVPLAGFDSSVISNLPASDYELLSPPSEVPDEDFANEARKMLSVTVSGILYDTIKPSAIINLNGSDYFVQIGDMLDTFQVVGITKQYVALKSGTNIYKAQVGENIEEQALGSKGLVSERRTLGQYKNARQYTSSYDVVVNVKDK